MPFPIARLVRSRRKTIALVIEPDGSLTVRAPQRMPEASIRAFVEQHRGWVEKNRKKAQLRKPPAPKQYREGESFLFLGRAHPLTILPRQRKDLVFDNQSGFSLRKAALPRAEQAFVRWYKEHATLVLFQRVVTLAAKYGLTHDRMRISSARTRWGSCGPTGTLSFTWRLVMAPPEVIDYVVTHELVHTRVRNHSPAFWKQVEELMPGYQAARRWLKLNGKNLSL